MAIGKTGAGIKLIHRNKYTWKGREKVMERYMRAAFHRMGKEGQLSSAHNYGHVSRVAFYATEYVKAMGGGRKKQAATKIAGFAHDRLRDPEDSLAQAARGIEAHEIRGAKYMLPMFEKRYKRSMVKTINEAMAKHGELPQLNEVGKNVVRDAVVFADKYFEANGAYIAFRRPMFLGERKDIRKKIAEKKLNPKNRKDAEKAAVEFTLEESDKRIKRFSDLTKTPPHLRKFLEYQVNWQKRLVKGLKSGDAAIINLVTELYLEGLKSHPRDLAEVISSYKPIGKADAEFKEEAVRYLGGKLTAKFRELLGK